MNAGGGSIPRCGPHHDAMNRLFSNDIAPLRAIRDLGLGIVDRVGPLGVFSCAKPAAMWGSYRG